jgi:hypothetical protein
LTLDDGTGVVAAVDVEPEILALQVSGPHVAAASTL